MNKPFRTTLVVAVGATIAILVGSTRSASSSAADAIFRLQSSTPGTQQVGHANLSGTLRAGQFVGGGAGVTGVNANFLNGLPSSAFLQSVPNPLFLSGSGPETILATNNGFQGVAIHGRSSGGSSESYGGLFENDLQGGTGVFGRQNASGGYGGQFYGAGFSSDGLLGYAANDAGTGIGVEGWARSPDGKGVYGLVVAGVQNAGVVGNSWSTDGNGMIAQATTGSFAYGIWAKAPQAVGVFCQGALQVTGNKAFRIDHPDDPENKYLLHYCSEGPEPLNVYRGNVTTDGTGSAIIRLPSYFEEINRDFSYQLTVIDDGEDFVLAKVSQPVKENSFSIRTSKPNVRVSWQVSGVRNDRYVRYYGAPVEVNKTEKDRGTYQHPELYGLPEERGFGYQPANRDTAILRR